MNEQEQIKKLRTLIRALIDRDIDEISTSAATTGYMIPHVFKGKKNKKCDESVNEGRSKYYEFKTNPDRKTHEQKIGISIREVKKSMKILARELHLVNRYKNEAGVSSDSFWKRTLKDIYKIETQLLQLSNQIREIKA